MPKLHRFLLENQCYHVATSTWRREPIFTERDNALAVVSALQFVRRERAFVLAYAVMPDHLHALLVPKEGYDISRIMQTVKGYTARLINQRLGRHGPLWQRSFYDRMIRDEHELLVALEYVDMNPVSAGLGETPEEYAFSSAGKDEYTDLEAYL